MTTTNNKRFAQITSKRALLREVSRRVHGTGRKSQWGRAVVKYAALLIQETTFKELDAAFRQRRLKARFLDGAYSWEQLGTSGGRFPFAAEDLARLFATPSGRDAFNRLDAEKTKEIIGRALYQAYAHISDVMQCSVRDRA